MGTNQAIADSIGRLTNLFKDFTIEQMDEIINACDKIILEKGKVLFREGQKGQAIFVLLAGTVKVTTHRGKVFIAKITPLRVIGEIGMLLSLRRSATVTAEGFVQLLRLSKKKLTALMEDDPDLQMKIYRNLCYILSEKLLKDNIKIEEDALSGVR